MIRVIIGFVPDRTRIARVCKKWLYHAESFLYELGHPSLIESAFYNGASHTLRRSGKVTQKHLALASRYGLIEIVRYLIKTHEITSEDLLGRALIAACMGSNSETILLLSKLVKNHDNYVKQWHFGVYGRSLDLHCDRTTFKKHIVIGNATFKEIIHALGNPNDCANILISAAYEGRNDVVALILNNMSGMMTPDEYVESCRRNSQGASLYHGIANQVNLNNTMHKDVHFFTLLWSYRCVHSTATRFPDIIARFAGIQISELCRLLMAAAQGGLLWLVKMLVQAKVQYTDDIGLLGFSSVEIIKTILPAYKFDDASSNILKTAIKHENLQVIDEFIKGGVSPCEIIKEWSRNLGVIHLCLSRMKPADQLDWAIEHGDIPRIRELIKITVYTRESFDALIKRIEDASEINDCLERTFIASAGFFISHGYNIDEQRMWKIIDNHNNDVIETLALPLDPDLILKHVEDKPIEDCDSAIVYAVSRGAKVTKSLLKRVLDYEDQEPLLDKITNTDSIFDPAEALNMIFEQQTHMIHDCETAIINLIRRGARSTIENIKLMIHEPVVMNIVDAIGCTCEHVFEVMIELGIPFDYNEAFLHACRESLNVPVIKLLLEAGNVDYDNGLQLLYTENESLMGLENLFNEAVSAILDRKFNSCA